ncbi:hypothetical protein JKF63_02274 [Porcisia hertigi]|uniref:Uncharacterized protein n=1 Tax=Porcisia hertigi TaxID=2761500 RepID=A0A836HP99_9TRYP|nr:hypothetical protein JKF63_02274 [Porcisia hertigi]
MDRYQNDISGQMVEGSQRVQNEYASPPVKAGSTENIYATYAAVKAELEAARAAHDARVREITQDNPLDCDANALPSLEELRLERARLSEQVRHHKDEQDSLALDIEGLPGAAEVYQLAARVQRLEHFAKRASEYVKDALPQEIEKTIEEDRRQSSAELVAYIEELQNKRARILKKVTVAQESISRRRAGNAIGGKRDSQDSLSPLEAEEVAHTEENKGESVVLHEKIMKFRSIRTQLQIETVKQKSESEKMEESMRRSIRNAELANSRDARQCREMNTHNAALTTTAQLLMDQLNVEHYGFDGAPTSKQLLEDRKRREATPEPTPAEYQQHARRTSGASHDSRQSHTNSTSSIQSAAKSSPMAMKRTESQRTGDNADREAQEGSSVSHDHQHSSSMGSHDN